MSFVSDDAPKSRIFKQQHIIVDSCLIVLILLEYVTFTIIIVSGLLIGESLYITIFSIYNYAFIKRSRGHNIFHASHELKSVLVQLYDVADAYSAKLVFAVIFL